jgi:hypothetical protein
MDSKGTVTLQLTGEGAFLGDLKKQKTGFRGLA